MESRTLTIDGAEVRWRESGAGAPVVPVHGIPTSPALWRRVVPLVDGVRCLAFEMAGYGESMGAARPQNISVASQADRLLSWLDALNIDRAVLVGHDLGGGVVQIAAVRRPGIAAGILLTNCISQGRGMLGTCAWQDRHTCKPKRNFCQNTRCPAG